MYIHVIKYVELGRFSAAGPFWITAWHGWNQKSSNRMILLVFVYTVLILYAINHGIVHFKKRFQILKRPKMGIILHFTFLTIYYHIISAISHKNKLLFEVFFSLDFVYHWTEFLLNLIGLVLCLVRCPVLGTLQGPESSLVLVLILALVLNPLLSLVLGQVLGLVLSLSLSLVFGLVLGLVPSPVLSLVLFDEYHFEVIFSKSSSMKRLQLIFCGLINAPLVCKWEFWLRLTFLRIVP